MKEPKSAVDHKILRDSSISTGDDPDDIWKKTRAACIKAIIRSFDLYISKHSDAEVTITSSELSKLYEKYLYKKYQHSLNSYKLRFRKDLTALRNTKNSFTKDLLKGELSMQNFVNFVETDLISSKQKEANNKFLDDELKNKMGKTFPKNINQIQNQNMSVGENWGIPESAAKIDPEFDLDDGV